MEDGWSCGGHHLFLPTALQPGRATMVQVMELQTPLGLPTSEICGRANAMSRVGCCQASAGAGCDTKKWGCIYFQGEFTPCTPQRSAGWWRSKRFGTQIHTNPGAEMSRKVSAGHPTVPGHPGPTCSRWAGGHSLGTVGYQVEPAGDKKWFLPSTTSFLLPQGGQARAGSSGKLPNVGSRRAKVGQEISEQT